jgi:hypothetical protein
MGRLSRYFTIRACVRDLSQRLAREYGLRDSYSPAEIDKVIAVWEMHLSVPAYAYALFCTRADFERLDSRVRGALDYDQYRGDVLRQYRGLEHLNGQAIAVFVASEWRSGLRFGGETEASPLLGLPDSFARESDTPPPRVTPPIYEEPTLGMRGVILWTFTATAVIVVGGFLVARFLLE